MRLAALAWVALATHVAAALGSLFLLQPGTPVGPSAAEREAYVATHLAAWRVGWLLWTLASLSLVALLFALDKRGALPALAALPFDLSSQLLLSLPAPALERAAYVGTGVVANGLYTLALAWTVARAPLPRALRLGALPAIAAGVVVAAASALDAPTLLFLSTGALTMAMIGWTLALGVWARRAS
ncbi:MAG TPA: hypothetical protein VFH78_03925 [Candidatus Thermoplasmatota archaeon]|nr:hypothetical protein [Candidatus Thermoplasmatota archaeon]